MLSARTKSQGNAGPDESGNGNFVSIFVNVQDLNITGGGQILAPTYSTKAAGNILVNASGTVTIQGKDANYISRRNELRDAFLPPNPTQQQVAIAADRALTTIDPIAPNSGIYASDLNTILDPNGLGKPGTVLVRANTVQLFETGLIEASTSGTKDAGAIGILTQNLTLTGGSEIVSQTLGSGKAGGIYVRPLDPSLRSSASITLSGIAPYTGLDSDGNPTGGFSSGLFVTTEMVKNQNQIDPITQQPILNIGAGGLIDVETGVLQITDAAVLSARSRSSGNGGDVKISVDRLDLKSGGQILTAAYKDGNAGNVTVEATGAIKISGQDSNHVARFNQIRDDIFQDLTRRRNETNPSNETRTDAYEGARFTVDPFNGASGLQANVGQNATANAGFIKITAGSLSMSDRGEIGTSIYGKGKAGNVVINSNDGIISLDNSNIFSTVEAGGEGSGGNIFLTTKTLFLSNGGSLQTLLRSSSAEQSSGGKGDTGNIFVIATDSISLSNKSAIFSTIELGAEGNSERFAGNIFNVFTGEADINALRGFVFVQTGTLSAIDGSGLTTSTLGIGNAGAVAVLASGEVSLANDSGIFSAVAETAKGMAGGIVLEVGSLSATNGSGLTTSTFGQGDAGLIFVQASDDVSLDGAGSGIFSSVGAKSTNTGGGIGIISKNLSITNNAVISVNNDGLAGAAGDIAIITGKAILDRNGTISGTTQSGRGGNIELNAGKYLLLRRDSNISTTAGLKPAGGDGGNITINTPFIIAAPSKNNDITANAFSGDGGKVYVSAPDGSKTGLFGIRFRPKQNPLTNDITASSELGLQGFVSINALDTTLVENSLTELAQNLIDPNALLASSCIVRNRSPKHGQSGTFLVTGSGGLPIRPNDAPLSSYPTGEVRSLPEERGEGRGGQGEQGRQGENKIAQNSSDRSWQPGDAIVEPQGIYRLASGRLVMSRECEPRD